MWKYQTKGMDIIFGVHTISDEKVAASWCGCDGWMERLKWFEILEIWLWWQRDMVMIEGMAVFICVLAECGRGNGLWSINRKGLWFLSVSSWLKTALRLEWVSCSGRTFRILRETYDQISAKFQERTLFWRYVLVTAKGGALNPLLQDAQKREC